MIPQPVTWLHIEAGMYVKDATGTTWRVDGKRRDDGDPDGYWRFLLRDAAGRAADVPAHLDTGVWAMIPTIDEAEAMIARMLPVSGVRRKVLRMEHLTTHPDTKWARAALASHLLELHGESVAPSSHVENADMAGLLELHAASHARPHTHVVPHVHVMPHEL